MKKIQLFFRICKTKIIYNKISSIAYSRTLFFCGYIMLIFSKAKSAYLIMRAHRNERIEPWRIMYEKTMLKFGLLHPNLIDSLIPLKFRHDGFYHGRVFLLKEKIGNEKGVIIIKYNETFAKLYDKFDISKILQDYYLCIELSYYGFCTPEILQFEKFKDAGICIGLVHDLEEHSIKRICKNIHPVYYSSSTWVDERKYYDMQLEKTYDCIMVAMCNNIKRHHLLFKAVQEINDPTYRVCLVGGPWGLVLDDIKDLADYYNVTHNIDFFERIPPEEVNLLINKSKVNLLLSLKEGGNKAIIEGLFANVPAIILDEHIGVDLAWINKHTGIITSKEKMKDALLEIRLNYLSFQPRQWAIENISCHTSTANLEKKLQEIATSKNELWTTPICKKINRPELEYYNLEDKLPGFEYQNYIKK